MSDEFSRSSAEGTVREAHWEGWTPPWIEHGEQGPAGHVHGFAGPWHGGPWQGWGHRRWRGPRGPFFGPGRRWSIPDELLALRVQAAEVARLFAIASRGAFGNKERLTQLRAFLDRSRQELTEIIYGSAQGQARNPGEQASSSAESGEA